MQKWVFPPACFYKIEKWKIGKLMLRLRGKGDPGACAAFKTTAVPKANKVLRNQDLGSHSSDKAVTHPHSWLLQQEASPAPGGPDPLHCTVPSSVQHWQHIGADAEGAKPVLARGPLCCWVSWKILEPRPPAFHAWKYSEKENSHY